MKANPADDFFIASCITELGNNSLCYNKKPTSWKHKNVPHEAVAGPLNNFQVHFVV